MFTKRKIPHEVIPKAFLWPRVILVLAAFQFNASSKRSPPLSCVPPWKARDVQCVSWLKEIYFPTHTTFFQNLNAPFIKTQSVIITPFKEKDLYWLKDVQAVESENLNKNNDCDNNFCDYYRARTPSATIRWASKYCNALTDILSFS